MSIISALVGMVSALCVVIFSWRKYQYGQLKRRLTQAYQREMSLIRDMQFLLDVERMHAQLNDEVVSEPTFVRVRALVEASGRRWSGENTRSRLAAARRRLERHLKD